MLRDFRSYAALDVAFDGAADRFRRRERRRQDQSAGGAVAVLAGPRPAARGTRRMRAVGGAGGFSVAIEVEEDGERRPLGLGLEPGADGPSGVNRIDRAPVALGARLLRPCAAGLADAGDGPAARRARERAAQISRPAGARDRPATWRAGRPVRARAARPQPAVGGGRAQRRLARRARARGGRTRRRDRGGAGGMRRRGSRATIPAARDDASPFPWAELALQGEVEALAARTAGAGGGGPLSRAAARRPRAATRRRGAR